jgi:CubicO group peptidase (beta-lactamase class C family)
VTRTSSGAAGPATQALEEIRTRRPVVGLAAVVVRPGETAEVDASGWADLASGRPFAADTVVRVASITKTFTAIAVMQLTEQGLLDLDTPVNDVLRSLRLTPARPGLGPVTIRHLLTHTAGLGELAHPTGVLRPDFGESVPAGEPLPTLADLYGGRLRVHAQPGTRFVYSNHAPAVLGQLVEDVTGTPLHAHLREHVLDPLGMENSDLRRTPHLASRLATGYEIGSRGVRAVAERDMVTTGAASLYSTPADMARYLAALLAGGRGQRGSILRPETLALMLSPQYQPDPRVPGMGLGFFRYRVGRHVAVGHQGTHPGFHAQVLLVPDAGPGVALFTNGGHHPDFWLPAAASTLLRAALGEPTEPRHDGPHRPDLWPDLCGRYRLPARLTDSRLRGMLGAGASVFVRSGRLMLRFLTVVPALARGFPLQPDDPQDPWVFRVDLEETGMDPLRVVFAPGTHGAPTRLHLEIMPVTLVRHRAPRPPRW